MAKTQRTYIRSNPIRWRDLIDSVGRNIKILSEMTGQSERQVRRNLNKLDRGEEIGRRGYGKKTSLTTVESYTFMCMKYQNKSKTEIEEALALSDSKYRRIEKLVTIPQCVVKREDAIAVKLSSRYTSFFIIWYLEDGNLKTTFQTDFVEERVNDDGLCLKLIDIISNGYEISSTKKISFFDEIEGRKVERCENEQERLNYYLHYFYNLTPQFEGIEEIKRYFGLSVSTDCDKLTNFTNSLTINESNIRPLLDHLKLGYYTTYSSASESSSISSPFTNDSDNESENESPLPQASESSSISSPFTDDSDNESDTDIENNSTSDSSTSESDPFSVSDLDFENHFLYHSDYQVSLHQSFPEFDEIWFDDYNCIDQNIQLL